MSIIGEMHLRNYDEGIVRTLGAEVIQAPAIEGGADRAYNVVDVPGISPEQVARFDGKVPILWIGADAAYQDYTFPSLIIRRMAPEFDYTGYSWYGIAARAPANDASPVVDPVTGQEGYDKYVEQWQAEPCRIQYEIRISARLRSEYQSMFRYVMKHCPPPGFTVKCVDTKGDVRHYDAGPPVTVTDTTELNSINNRSISSQVGFAVRGELDIRGTYEVTPLTSAPNVAYNLDND